MQIRCLVVDDEQGAQEVLIKLLKQYPEISVEQICFNVDEAIDAIFEHQPDLLFLDVQMPNKSGFDLINEIKPFQLKPTVIFTTAYDKYAIQAIKASAFDFLLKPIVPSELKDAIFRYKAEVQNQNALHKIDLLYQELVKTQNLPKPTEPAKKNLIPKHEKLTDSELEVLPFIAQGKTRLEIAELLNVSFDAIKTRIRNIHNKWDVHNDIELRNKANELGLL
jgi:two-component system LytT family response regulator